MIDSGQLADFNAAATEALLEIGGVKFTFRGEEIQGRIGEQETIAELADGGIAERGQFTIRLPGTVTPAPALKEILIETGTGRKFVVVGRDPHNPHQLLRTWHTLRVELA